MPMGAACLEECKIRVSGMNVPGCLGFLESKGELN
jgi:hypothetical protein